jgi:hypothetical protein
LDYDVEIRKVVCSTDENVNRALGCSSPFLVLAAAAAWLSAARSRGQGGAPGWTNDLDRGEDRSSVRAVVGVADRRAKSSTWDWKCCRAA